MWLINTDSLELNYFVSCPVEEYAILSHTWDAEEVSFQEFREKRNQSKRGYRKIEQCCRQASSEGLRYAWVDTCCIDKTSSAELSEAINSMFAYYRDARVCYAFLADFMLHGRYESIQDPLDPIARHSAFTCAGCTSAFRKSRWFSRSWTLQELLAPKSLLFYDVDWKFVGSKHDLAEVISTATRIDVQVLMSSLLISTCSVAQRMSWASTRTATRVEDVAYSLLGIFGINLPLLYGEGDKAFTRLQRTIVENSSDETIFAWRDVDPKGDSFFAKHPSQFRDAGAMSNNLTSEIRSPFTFTSRGISIDVKLIPCAMNTYMIPLLCWDRSLDGTVDERKIFIFVSSTNLDNTYRRIRINDIDYGNFHNRLPSLQYSLFSSSIDFRSVYLSNDMTSKVRAGIVKPEITFTYRIKSRPGVSHPKEVFNLIDCGNTSWDISTLDRGNDAVKCRCLNLGKPTVFPHNWQYHLKSSTVDEFATENLVLGGTVANINPVTHFTGPVFRYLHVGFDKDFRPTCYIAFTWGTVNVKTKKTSRVIDPHGRPLFRCFGPQAIGFSARFEKTRNFWSFYSISLEMAPRSTSDSTSQRWDCKFEVATVISGARLWVFAHNLCPLLWINFIFLVSIFIRYLRVTTIVVLILLLTTPLASQVNPKRRYDVEWMVYVVPAAFTDWQVWYLDQMMSEPKSYEPVFGFSYIETNSVDTDGH